MTELRIFPKTRQIPEKKPKTFILFAKELVLKQHEPFEVKERESMHLIRLHLQKFKKPYVATSRGKDSLVMEHLVIRVCKELGIPKPEFWLNNTLNIYPEETAYWIKMNKFLGIEDKFKVFTPPKLPNGKQATVWSIADMVGHLPNFRRTARQKLSYKKTNVPECCDILKHKSINSYLKEKAFQEKFDLNFVGTRASESQMRSLGVLQRCRSYVKHFRIPYPIQILTPLSFWTSIFDYQALAKGYHDDIWHYFEKYDIPINPAYEAHNIVRMGCASCPAYKGWEIDQARDPTEHRMGQLRQNLIILKKTEPERFEEAIQNLFNYKGKLNPKVYDIINELSPQKTLILDTV